MLDFHWECIDFKFKKIKDILKTIIIAPIFFTKIIVGMETGNKITADTL